MDMESALMSFLSLRPQATSHAPISIDIYGANGWYRSGVRTGQDVELLSRYVDAICPMFYPSHFEQDFMAFEPAIHATVPDLPHRDAAGIRISPGKRVVIRPYVQAFYLNVRYDRAWYSPTYVSPQVDGVRDASNEGLTVLEQLRPLRRHPGAQDRPRRQARLAAAQQEHAGLNETPANRFQGLAGVQSSSLARTRSRYSPLAGATAGPAQ